MRKLLICYNLDAGQTQTLLPTLKTVFKAQMVEASFIPLNQLLSTKVKKAKSTGVTHIIAAGGDGTVNAVAAQAYKYKMILGVLPVGTLNHFAKDLGLPSQLELAVKLVCTGQPILIDVGMVNQYIFLNNSSIGVYPALVKEREKHQSFLGKWPAALLALFKVAIKLRRYHITLRFESETLNIRTPFLFVGNNEYQLHKIGLTNRTRIQSGNLSLYWIKTSHFMPIVRIFARALTGQVRKDKAFEARTVGKVTLELPQKEVKVAFDGEVVRLKAPLHYEIKHKALQVIA
jgi:diacylglycerol kinase family enzyme